MIRYIVAVLCSLVLLSATSTSEAERPMNLVKISLIPFGVTTYVPITKDDIEGKSFFRVFLVAEDGVDLHPLVRKLKGWLESQAVSRRLDEKSIRLKVEFAKETYFGDSAGVVLHQPSGHTFYLGQLEKKQIEELIAGLQGVIDIKATRRVDPSQLR